MLDTIYIGGGTPSVLNIKQLKRLLDMLDILKKSNNCEYTMECNFESIDSLKLDLMIKHGINRVSFGMQTINERLLSRLNRHHNKQQIINIINLTKNKGINNINIDLLYALPNEVINDLKEDLSFLMSLDIPHVSTYSLMIEPHTLFYINNVKSQDEDSDVAMYKLIQRYLKEKDYQQYEISNFAKKGYQCLHNLTYWDNNEYYGFGLGACGYINNYRYNNTRGLNKYLKGCYRYEIEKLTIDDKMSYETILGLRKRQGIDKQAFFNKYKKNIDNVFDYQHEKKLGLLKENNEYLWIPEDKLYLSNEAMVAFVGGSTYEK